MSHRPRAGRPAVLDVRIAEVVADGRLVDPAREIELPYGHNNLELNVAAPSFRDPGRVRHRIRFDANDPWSEPSAEGVFRYQHVPPGSYRIEVASSLYGTSWIPAAAPIVVRVHRPWYLQWTVLVSFVLAAGVIAYTAYRARLARLAGRFPWGPWRSWR